MNKVILAGRLTKNPEIRYTQTGKAVASIAQELEFMGTKPIAVTTENKPLSTQAQSFGSEVPEDEEIPF